MEDDYGYIIDELKTDPKYLEMTKTTRNTYVTHKYGVTRDIADLIMADLKWRGIGDT